MENRHPTLRFGSVSNRGLTLDRRIVGCQPEGVGAVWPKKVAVVRLADGATLRVKRLQDSVITYGKIFWREHDQG